MSITLNNQLCRNRNNYSFVFIYIWRWKNFI